MEMLNVECSSSLNSPPENVLAETDSYTHSTSRNLLIEGHIRVDSSQHSSKCLALTRGGLEGQKPPVFLLLSVKFFVRVCGELPHDRPILADRARYWAGISRVPRIMTRGIVLRFSQVYSPLFQIDATRYTEG